MTIVILKSFAGVVYGAHQNNSVVAGSITTVSDDLEATREGRPFIIHHSSELLHRNEVTARRI